MIRVVPLCTLGVNGWLLWEIPTDMHLYETLIVYEATVWHKSKVWALHTRRIIPVNNWFNYSVDGLRIFLLFSLLRFAVLELPRSNPDTQTHILCSRGTWAGMQASQSRALGDQSTWIEQSQFRHFFCSVRKSIWYSLHCVRSFAISFSFFILFRYLWPAPILAF